MAKSQRASNNRSRKGRRSRATQVFSLLSNVSTSIVANPTFIICLILGFYLSTHTTEVTKFLNKFTNTLLKPIVDYLKLHIDKVPGALLLTSTSLSLTQSKYSIISTIISGVLVFEFLPASTKYLEYCILAFFNILFWKIKSTRAKILVVVLAAITISAGLWGKEFFPETKSKS